MELLSQALDSIAQDLTRRSGSWYELEDVGRTRAKTILNIRMAR